MFIFFKSYLCFDRAGRTQVSFVGKMSYLHCFIKSSSVDAGPIEVEKKTIIFQLFATMQRPMGNLDFFSRITDSILTLEL